MSVAGQGTTGNFLTLTSAATLLATVQPNKSWTTKFFVCPSGGPPPQGDGFQTFWDWEDVAVVDIVQFYFDQSPNNRVLHYLNGSSDTAVSGGNLSNTLPTAIVATMDPNVAGGTTIIYRRDPTSNTITNQSITGVSLANAQVRALLFTYSGDSEPLFGELYGLAWWSRVLSATEAANETYSIRAVTRDSLVSEMCQPSLATLGIDQSGHSQNGVLTGTLINSTRNAPVRYGGPGIIM